MGEYYKFVLKYKGKVCIKFVSSGWYLPMSIKIKLLISYNFKKLPSY